MGAGQQQEQQHVARYNGNNFHQTSLPWYANLVASFCNHQPGKGGKGTKGGKWWCTGQRATISNEHSGTRDGPRTLHGTGGLGTTPRMHTCGLVGIALHVPRIITIQAISYAAIVVRKKGGKHLGARLFLQQAKTHQGWGNRESSLSSSASKACSNSKATQHRSKPWWQKLRWTLRRKTLVLPGI